MEFEFLDRKTKKAQYFISSYVNSKWSSLTKKYKTKCSQKKLDVENEILKEAQIYGSKDTYRVLSAGQTYFTCGYRVDRHLVVHTPCHRYLISYAFAIEK